MVKILSAIEKYSIIDTFGISTIKSSELRLQTANRRASRAKSRLKAGLRTFCIFFCSSICLPIVKSKGKIKGYGGNR
jgi:hypothetical protein